MKSKIIESQKFLKEVNKRLLKKLRKSIFIYPTDTIYGIGCDATKDTLVKKIREIKQRPSTPFSIIVPSKEWIYENCIVEKKHEKYLKFLPGPYTLIFKLKNKNSISKNVSLSNTIGVRIPLHWISDIVAWLNVPIVTTSANISGKPHMTSLKDLNKEIKSKVDLIIYEGPKQGRPSTIIDLTKKKAVIIKR